MERLTENFEREEFACRDQSGDLCECGRDTVDYLLLMILQAMRDAYGRCTVTSGNRCSVQNTRAGGLMNSQHLYSRAVDCSFATGTPAEWAELAERLGATGIGVYSNWVHIDTRTGPKARW